MRIGVVAPARTVSRESSLRLAAFMALLNRWSGDVDLTVSLNHGWLSDIVVTLSHSTATVVAANRVLALKVNATLMDQVSRDCQLRFYKVFTETLIYRLSMTSAKLSALSV